MSDSSYVTTNIRISKRAYLRLKQEAAEKRKSFSAIVREKVGDESSEKDSQKEFLELLKRTRGLLAGKSFYINERKRRQREIKASEELTKW